MKSKGSGRGGGAGEGRGGGRGRYPFVRQGHGYILAAEGLEATEIPQWLQEGRPIGVGESVIETTECFRIARAFSL